MQLQMIVRAIALWLVTFLWVCGGWALAKQPTYLVGLKPPSKVAGFVRGEQTDFEAKSPGLGYGISYVRKGWRAHVFIYDLGIAGIPDGPLSRQAASQFDQAAADIPRGFSGWTVEQSEQFFLPDGDTPKFLCGQYLARRNKNESIDTYLCLTGAHGNFVKFRLSVGSAGGTRKRVEDFVSSWDQVLWP